MVMKQINLNETKIFNTFETIQMCGDDLVEDELIKVLYNGYVVAIRATYKDRILLIESTLVKSNVDPLTITAFDNTEDYRNTIWEDILDIVEPDDDYSYENEWPLGMAHDIECQFVHSKESF